MAEPQDPNSQAAGQSPAANPPSPPLPKGGDAAVDVQTEIQKALAAQSAAHAKQLKELTGFDTLKAFQEAELKKQGKTQELLDAKTKEAADYKVKFEQHAIRAAIVAAAANSHAPDQVAALLLGNAAVDDAGNVTLAGKPVKDAVASFLKENAHFVKGPAGGSGAPQTVQTGGAQSLTRAAFEALDAGARMAHIKSGGQVTD